MAIKKLSCMRCNSFMEKGFMPDFSDSGVKQALWVPGEPVKSFWAGGLKIDKKEKVPVQVMRCTRCGHLEFFANPISDS